MPFSYLTSLEWFISLAFIVITDILGSYYLMYYLNCLFLLTFFLFFLSDLVCACGIFFSGVLDGRLFLVSDYFYNSVYLLRITFIAWFSHSQIVSIVSLLWKMIRFSLSSEFCFVGGHIFTLNTTKFNTVFLGVWVSFSLL